MNQQAATMPRRIRLYAAIAGAVVVLALIGGYVFGWEWTGARQHAELWEVLHLLVLPVVLASLPLWYRTRVRFGRAWRMALAILAAVSVVVVLGGYVLGWTWTGFEGNTLWDWLELLVLPVALGLMPVWLESGRRVTGGARSVLPLAAIAFTALVVGGYFLDWEWTGFAANTLWDWLGLLLVPFAVPAAIAWYLRSA